MKKGVDAKLPTVGIYKLFKGFKWSRHLKKFLKYNAMQMTNVDYQLSKRAAGALFVFECRFNHCLMNI